MQKIPLPYDLGKAKRSEFTTELIPAGFYKFDINRTAYKKAADGKEGSIIIGLKVADVGDPINTDFIGCEFGDFVSMSMKADWRMANLMDSVYGRRVEGTEVDIDDLVGRSVCAQVKVEVFEGRSANKIERYSEPAKFHKQAGSTSGTAARAKPAQPAQGSLPGTQGGKQTPNPDDEIAF